MGLAAAAAFKLWVPSPVARKKVEGHSGRGGQDPLIQPCLLRENCPMEKARAPWVSGGPAQAGSGAAALRSSQVDQQRHAQSVPSPFSAPLLSIRGLPTKEGVGTSQGRWPGAPIRRAPQFCTCAVSSKDVSRHRTRPPTGLRSVFPRVI